MNTSQQLLTRIDNLQTASSRHTDIHGGISQHVPHGEQAREGHAEQEGQADAEHDHDDHAMTDATSTQNWWLDSDMADPIQGVRPVRHGAVDRTAQ